MSLPLNTENLQLLINLIPEEKISFWKRVFEQFDVDNSKTLDGAELGEVIHSMGCRRSEEQIRMAIATITGNQDTRIVNFEQFVALMQLDLLGISTLPRELVTEAAPQAITEPIQIAYFIDILCIWAYIAQIRIDELKSTFKNQIVINYHFVSVFGDARHKLENRWRDRGGLAGYSNHVQEVVARFNHLSVHPEVWKNVTPHSSTSSHLFLKAIHLLESKGLVESKGTQSCCERAIAALRQAFFQDLQDISHRKVQWSIAEALEFPISQIQAEIDSGAAYAELSRDFQEVKDYNVTVSPTMIFNEGRQRLNGNVGYRVMESNIRELIYNVPGEASWC